MRPEFFKHVELYEAEVSSGLPLRVAFAGLWTVADRRGIFAWSRSIKPDILPYDPCDFIAVLDALARGDFVRKYESGGKSYGIIPSFPNHQNFHIHEKASAAPEPPESIMSAPYQHDASTMPAPVKHRTSISRSTSTSTSTSSSKTPIAEQNWLGEPLAIWEVKFGEGSGTAVAGRLAKAIRPLLKIHDMAFICRQLRYYVEQTEPRYANPQTFAQKIAAWKPEPGTAEYDAEVKRKGEEFYQQELKRRGPPR